MNNHRVWTQMRSHTSGNLVRGWYIHTNGKLLRVEQTGRGYWLRATREGGWLGPFPNWHALERKVDHVLTKDGSR